jgi:hypothetical protein
MREISSVPNLFIDHFLRKLESSYTVAVKPYFSKKGLHNCGGWVTIPNMRGFSFEAPQYVKWHGMGMWEIGDYGRYVLFITGSHRKA